jgi:hypothetical protein
MGGAGEKGAGAIERVVTVRYSDLDDSARVDLSQQIERVRALCADTQLQREHAYFEYIQPARYICFGTGSPVTQAFGPDGLGIIAVEGVPGYPALRERLLLLAERLAVRGAAPPLSTQHQLLQGARGLAWALRGVPAWRSAAMRRWPGHRRGGEAAGDGAQQAPLLLARPARACSAGRAAQGTKSRSRCCGRAAQHARAGTGGRVGAAAEAAQRRWGAQADALAHRLCAGASQASAPVGAPAPRGALPAPGRAGAAAGGRRAPGGPGQPVERRLEPRARGARGRPPRRAQGLLLRQPLPGPPRRGRGRGRALPQLLPVRRAARRTGRWATAGRVLREPVGGACERPCAAPCVCSTRGAALCRRALCRLAARLRLHDLGRLNMRLDPGLAPAVRT